jgi:LysR family transcriptional regulator, transcriptional activator of the cysJI operon
LNIESLRMFCLVVDEGTISKAARIGFVSQPAVTRQIQHLENFYGALLFDRIDGKLKVTDAGRMLYPYAKAIINDFQLSIEAVQQVTGEVNENLKVGASLTIGEYYLPSVLGSFKKQAPDLNVSLIIKNTSSIMEDLLNDEIDVALIEGVVDGDDSQIHIEKFADDELVLIHAADHPWEDKTEISIEEFVEEGMICRESESGTRIIVENVLREKGILDQIKNVMELNTTQAIKSAVEAGLGIAILSKLAVGRELELGVLKEVNVAGISFKRDLWLIEKKQRFSKNSVVRFLEYIK